MAVNMPSDKLVSLAGKDVEKRPCAWQKVYRAGGPRWFKHLAYSVLPHHSHGAVLSGIWQFLLSSLFWDVVRGGR
eukprot:6185074-Lingulodinium_polyedra.AAC.1